MNTPVGKQASADAYTALANDPDAPPPESVGLVLDDSRNPGIADPTKPAAPRSGQDANDQALNLIRRGVTVKPNTGPSLLQFIGQNGGLNDQGGEVSALDGDIWHKDRPFQRKIIQPGGVSLDEMAERAHGAGYFPDAAQPDWASGDNMHPVGGQDLLNAMHEELAGTPRYAGFDQDRADLRARMDDVQQHLDFLGLDPRQYSNADLKQAMQANLLGQTPPDLSRAAPPPEGEAYGPTGLTLGTAPTFQTWETVKRALDAKVERDAFRTPIPDSQSLGNAAIGKAGAALRNELVRINPAYGDALDDSGDYLGARSMFGQLKGKLFSGGFGAQDLQNALVKQTPNGPQPVSDFERQAAQSAALSDIYNKAQSSQLTPRLLDLPHVRNKLGILFGPDRADAISSAATQEADLQDAERRIPPAAGSQSAPLLQQGEEQASGLEGAKLLVTDAAADLFSGRPGGAATRLVGAAFTHAPKKAEMPIPVRNLAGQHLLGTPADLAAFLNQVRGPRPQPYGLFGGAAGAMGAQMGFGQPAAPAPVGLPKPRR